MTILIDVGDGSTIVAPLAAPPPPTPTATIEHTLDPALPPPPVDIPRSPDLAPAPSSPTIEHTLNPALPPPPIAPLRSPDIAPQLTTASTQGQQIIQPGQVFIDLGDVLGPSQLIPAPPATQPGGDGGGGDTTGGDTVGATDDLAAARALALANRPDLSNLPIWELLDPFDARQLASANPVLKGGSAVAAIVQACADYGVEGLAAIADALHEGANGGIGDGGLAYGPFQDHLTEFADRPFYGKGRNNQVVNAWAWTANGIRYSVRAMVNGSPSAKGLRGHAAVYAIVYGYERPQDEAGAYKTRAAEYDHLIRLVNGWADYAAPLFKGPAAGGATDSIPLGGGSTSAYKPAGVTAQWRGLVDVFKLKVPAEHDKVKALASSLKGVIG